jgi:hypothetical protein
MEEEKTNRLKKMNAWTKKVGIAGVIFFTAKGLLWLALGGVFLEKCLPN